MFLFEKKIMIFFQPCGMSLLYLTVGMLID